MLNKLFKKLFFIFLFIIKNLNINFIKFFMRQTIVFN